MNLACDSRSTSCAAEGSKPWGGLGGTNAAGGMSSRAVARVWVLGGFVACCVESCYAPEHAYGGMGPECARAEPRKENEQHV